MKKYTKKIAASLVLAMTLTSAAPAFAADTADNKENSTYVLTDEKTTESLVMVTTTDEPVVQKAAVKNGFRTVKGKKYYYKNGKKVTNKYGYKIGKNYYRISKKGVVTKVSEAEGLAGIRLDKCGGDLKKAFKWSSNLGYMADCGKPSKGQKEVEHYAIYGFKYGRGDCYVMAATFCMMAKVKGLKVYYVKGQIKKSGGRFGEHGWCEVSYKGKTLVYDPNFAKEFKGVKGAHSGYKFTYGQGGTLQYIIKSSKKV